jgi:hypothetical protein
MVVRHAEDGALVDAFTSLDGIQAAAADAAAAAAGAGGPVVPATVGDAGPAEDEGGDDDTEGKVSVSEGWTGVSATPTEEVEAGIAAVVALHLKLVGVCGGESPSCEAAAEVRMPL